MKIAVFISGSGRTLDNLLKAKLPADISLVVSNRPNIRGNDIANRAGVKLEILDKDLSSIWSLCEGISLICLAGFVDYIPVPPAWQNKIMNIHPSLLPSFGGKGMYGHRVHESVLKHGCKLSGCTVHFIDDQYDHGPIILQRSVSVYDNDTPNTLADRVFEQECIAYPQAIRCFAEGRLHVNGRAVSCSLISKNEASHQSGENNKKT